MSAPIDFLWIASKAMGYESTAPARPKKKSPGGGWGPPPRFACKPSFAHCPRLVDVARFSVLPSTGGQQLAFISVDKAKLERHLESGRQQGQSPG